MALSSPRPDLTHAATTTTTAPTSWRRRPARSARRAGATRPPFARFMHRIKTLTSRSTLNLSLDRLAHRVKRGDEEIPLQPREFRLLEYLMRHAGQVVTRTMLLENVWDYHFDPQTNVIDVHISRLRSKIDKGFKRPLLHTVRGAGYMIRDGAR